MSETPVITNTQTPVPLSGIGRIALGFLPFTPVSFKGPDMLIAWGRLAGYSVLAYSTYNKMKPLSYALMGAAGVSLATSLMSGIWSKQ
jgi:hypothetical protein